MKNRLFCVYRTQNRKHFIAARAEVILTRLLILSPKQKRFNNDKRKSVEPALTAIRAWFNMVVNNILTQGFGATEHPIWSKGFGQIWKGHTTLYTQA